MAVWSEISTSNLVGAIRLDAEFWQPQYLCKERQIRCDNHAHLGSLVTTFKKGIFYILAKEYTDQGIPFYRSSNVGSILPNDENVTFITKKKHKEEFKTSLTVGDLMLVKTGKSGASVVLNESCNVSQDVIAVKTIRSRINPFYLAVFLNTKYGISEMDRWFQGQVQPHLSLEDARKILVSLLPDSTQLEVERLVVASAEYRDGANSAWIQAQQLLEAELGLDKLHFEKPMGYTARFDELLADARIDADYFQPKYRLIKDKIKNCIYGYQPLLAICTSLKPNIDPSMSPVETFHYIELSNINSSLGMVDGAFEGLGASLPSRARRKVTPGDILASSVVGSIDKSAIITGAQDGFIASTGFFHLRPKSISSEYLLMLVRSCCVQMQLQQQSTGGILSAVPDSRLRNVIIPNVPQIIQDRITDLVRLSHEMKMESSQLIAQAKARVEQLIEKAVQK